MPPPIVVPPPPVSVRLVIEKKWAALRRDYGVGPGVAVSGVEPVRGGSRIRYQYGAIYGTGGGTGVWVYGAIGERYDAIGGATSWLGFPLEDEAPFTDGGRVSVFENGAIYWWPDTGAIDLNDVVVWFAGLHCFNETDEFSVSDEPYVIFTAVSPTMGKTDTRTPVYENFDTGESLTAHGIELYRGKPYGLVLTSVLMEHDEGDPDSYKALVSGAVGAAAAGTTAAIAAIPYVGAPLAVGAAALLKIAMPKIVDAVNDAFSHVFGLRDDLLGQWTIPLSAKEMVVLAARTPEAPVYGVPCKVVSPLIRGDRGNYALYLNTVGQ